MSSRVGATQDDEESTDPSTAVMLRSASQISFVAASRALEGDLGR
jgi:hypothetical protein